MTEHHARRGGSARRWVAALALSTMAACAGDRPQPDASQGAAALDDAALVDFHAHAEAFYGRFTGRRVNSLATFRDPALRERFQSEKSFSDYYAGLAQALVDAHFERNQPLEAEVEEFVLDGPGRARVRFHLYGENGLPLRFWGTSIEREDRWEREGGRWWVVPGRL